MQIGKANARLESAMLAAANWLAAGGRRPDGTPRPPGYYGFSVEVLEVEESGAVRGIRFETTFLAGIRYCCSETLCRFVETRYATAFRDAVVAAGLEVTGDFAIAEWVTVVEDGAELEILGEIGRPVSSPGYRHVSGSFKPMRRVESGSR